MLIFQTWLEQKKANTAWEKEEKMGKINCFDCVQSFGTTVENIYLSISSFDPKPRTTLENQQNITQ